MDPNPEAAGCHCPECFGLAEYMLERTGKDYGLPRRPQGCHMLIVRQAKPKPKPVPINREPAPQPWEPRRSRHAA